MKFNLFQSFKIIGVMALLAAPVGAQEITLKSVDGSISLSGDLLGFDGDNYTIQSSIGELLISATMVDCIGDLCPDLVAELEEFTIFWPNDLDAAFLPSLIEAYALERDGDLQIEFGGNGAAQFYVIDADGSVYSTITVNSGSNDDGFSALEQGEAAIGFSQRSANAAEIEQFIDLGLGDLSSISQENIVAVSGVTAIVHPDNPLPSLSLSELARVYSGELNNWSQLGGQNASISLYRLNAAGGSAAIFGQKVLATAGFSFANSATTLPSDAEIAAAVSQDINGIGISGIADAFAARILPIRSICGQVSTPSRFALKSEEYPLAQRLYMYTTDALRPERANEFMEFVVSETGQMVVENAGYTGQNVIGLSLDQQGRRIASAILAQDNATALGNLQNLLTTVLDAERLSLTFRFVTGTSDLDTRAQSDINRLAAMIQTGEFRDKQILILGFTDNIGSEAENARFSQARAELVREAVIAATGQTNLGDIKITPVGYGNTSPLACNETEAGQKINRRVEIWVR